MHIGHIRILSHRAALQTADTSWDHSSDPCPNEFGHPSGMGGGEMKRHTWRGLRGDKF